MMSKSTDTPNNETAPAKPISQRFVSCVQSTGRVGKSFTADVFLSWLKFAKVPHSVIDADVQHHTISDRHSDVELIDATGSEDGFRDLLANLPNAPVLVVDFPGQNTEKILAYAEHFRMMHAFAEKGIRPTLWIFMADDETAKNSAASTMEFFGTSADYILVDSSARFKSDTFKGTPLYDWFIGQGSPVLTVPRISSGTLNEWDAAQHQLERYLPLDEAAKLPSLSLTARLELDGARSSMLVQFEDHAARLVPDSSLIKNRVTRTQTQAAKRPTNRLGSALLSRK